MLCGPSTSGQPLVYIGETVPVNTSARRIGEGRVRRLTIRGEELRFC